MADPNIYFKNGAIVEVSSDDDGFRGAWYVGTIIRPAKGKKNKFVIEYKTLMDDKKGSKPLRETIDSVQLRPCPPQDRCRSFNLSQEVDAYHNEGWWEGIITDVLPSERYSVFFRGTREQLDFTVSDLRIHREWCNGKWIPSFEEPDSSSSAPNSSKEKPKEERVSKYASNEVHFNKGTLVEVSSDEEGFQGAWFAATVIEQLSEGRFIVEYQSLRNEDDTAFLQEEVGSQHIRPQPPNTLVVERFNQLEEVDALYNDGWWVGIVSKVLNKKYTIYFRGTNEELEFKHSELRLHQEWIDGKWVLPSQALKL